MFKKICILLLGVLFLPCVYADSISDLLDNAKKSYLNNDVSKTLEHLNTAKNELEKITFATNVSEYETVEYSRLRNFPARYKGKKIKLKYIRLSPTGIEREKKMNGNYYPIWVSGIYASDPFPGDPYEDGALFFIIGENLLDKLMDNVQGGVGYFNIYTDKIYEYIKKDYRTDKIQYIAKIVSLEQLTYDLFKEEPETTGVIWFE